MTHSPAAAVAAHPRTVLADLLPGTAVRDLLLIFGAAGFTGLMAQLVVPLPWTPVPLTGQTLAVLVSGAALGLPRAGAAMMLYLAAGVAGMPWFAEGASGWGGPTFGYLLGFIAAGMLVGWLAARGADRTPLKAVPAMLIGTLVIYAFGVPWLAADLEIGLGEAWELGAQPFLVGAVIKVLLGAGLLPAAWALADRR